jgi:hypothetical protein
VHRPIVHRFRLTAKFLPEFGQELEALRAV